MTLRTPLTADHVTAVASTADALTTRLKGKSLRSLAGELFGDTAKAGLLSDVLAVRAGHISHAALHDLRRRLGLSYEIRYAVDVPSDRSAFVLIAVGGDGSLTARFLAEDETVAVLPPTARIVFDGPAPNTNKPKRRRWRLDLTEFAGRVTASRVRELVRLDMEKKE